MKLKDIDIEYADMHEAIFEVKVPMSAINFHAYSCQNSEGGTSYGISYLSNNDKDTKKIKFQFSEFNDEVKEDSIFIGTFSLYAIHVFLLKS